MIVTLNKVSFRLPFAFSERRGSFATRECDVKARWGGSIGNPTRVVQNLPCELRYDGSTSQQRHNNFEAPLLEPENRVGGRITDTRNHHQ